MLLRKCLNEERALVVPPQRSAWEWTVRQLATIGIGQQPRYPAPYTQPSAKPQ